MLATDQPEEFQHILLQQPLLSVLEIGVERFDSFLLNKLGSVCLILYLINALTDSTHHKAKKRKNINASNAADKD